MFDAATPIKRSGSMNDKVQLLWYIQGNEKDTELLIGVYRTEEDSKAAIQRLKGKPGFVDSPDGFMAE